MNYRWDRGFTIVEMLIVVVVLAIIAAISVVGYNGIRLRAVEVAAQSDLRNAATAIQLEQINTGTYPTTMPPTVQSSDNITLELVRSGTGPFYTGLTAVQNGVLLSKICSDLVAEGVGNGIDQGGATRPYLTGCGNWNHNSMQITGWQSRVWPTPVTSAQLLNYANTFTTSSTWDKDQERVVKNFYQQLVARQTVQGGTYPVTSFWDSWANSGNGGVIKQELPTNVEVKSYFCVEATVSGASEAAWHIDESGNIKPGGC